MDEEESILKDNCSWAAMKPTSSSSSSSSSSSGSRDRKGTTRNRVGGGFACWGREREKKKKLAVWNGTENWFFFFELFCQFYPWLLCNDFCVHCRFISWYEDKRVLLTYFEFCPLLCGFPIDHGSLFVFFFFKWRIIVGILWQSKG